VHLVWVVANLASALRPTSTLAEPACRGSTGLCVGSGSGPLFIDDMSLVQMAAFRRTTGAREDNEPKASSFTDMVEAAARASLRSGPGGNGSAPLRPPAFMAGLRFSPTPVAPPVPLVPPPVFIDEAKEEALALPNGEEVLGDNEVLTAQNSPVAVFILKTEGFFSKLGNLVPDPDAACGWLILLAGAVIVVMIVQVVKDSLKRTKWDAYSLDMLQRPPMISVKQVLEQDCLRKEEPKAVQNLPPPMRRLRCIGASYVVPCGHISNCSSAALSFDIPTLPCVWPLRALLSRPSPNSPWASLQLTVDIIAASGLPPLLTCTRVDSQMSDQECGGTGGTGSMSGSGLLGTAGMSLGLHRSSGPRAHAVVEDCLSSPWLKINNAGGAVVATIYRQQDGACMVQRQDRSVWDLLSSLDVDLPWITISKQGHEICQASSLGRGKEENIQVDTQPDVQSRESFVLLMCTLGVLAFQP